MRAYQLHAYHKPPELTTVDTPEPGPGEVVVKVAGSGACHSDLHLEEWPAEQMEAFGWSLPFTLGHENAGWVERVGAGVTGVGPGLPVAVYGPWGCGMCYTCRQGKENYCERAADQAAMGGGLGRDGGMAEYLLVPSARLLLPLPGDLDPRDAAPLSDAALTPYHALKPSLPGLVGGTTAVVIGVGGLGHMGVRLLRELTGARVIGVDVDAHKLKLAEESGAHRTVRAGDEAVAEIRALTRGGLGAELVLDSVGSNPTLALASQIVRQEGDLSVVGLGGGALTWAAMGVLPWKVNLTSTYWGTMPELAEVLELAADGRLRAHTTRFPLESAADAYQQLRSGELVGRAVITPHG